MPDGRTHVSWSQLTSYLVCEVSEEARQTRQEVNSDSAHIFGGWADVLVRVL